MSLITMYAHTAITVTARHIRRGLQNKARAGACHLIGLPDHPKPDSSEQQSNKFFATNVTKKLDHNNRNIITVGG